MKKTWSDSGILVQSDGKWYTSGWLSRKSGSIRDERITISGNMWKVPDKTMSPVSNILLRLFQMTLGRSSTVSLWMKERLRDVLITKTKPSDIRYNRMIIFNEKSGELMKIMDSVESPGKSIASIAIFAKDTHIYVPSSRYYVDMKDAPVQKYFVQPVDRVDIEWSINSESGVRFRIQQ